MRAGELSIYTECLCSDLPANKYSLVLVESYVMFLLEKSNLCVN